MVLNRWRALLCPPLIALAWLLPSTPAAAHEQRSVDGQSVVVGWEVEPAFTGVANAVGVMVTSGGRPVEGLELKAEVIFGTQDSSRRTAPLDLEPAFGQPGKYTAPILPSRPGTYTFHITGELGGRPFDQSFTSGEGTFDSVTDPEEFPVKDPTRAELAERTERLLSRIDPARDRPSGSVRGLAIAGIVVGLAGLLVGLVALVLARRAGASASTERRRGSSEGEASETAGSAPGG
ncbi:MAG: hypothetical protein M3198_05790 [Actinomycetota bacterium]|nr:hypothetical protein [Actinomycetota bacterium]